MTGEVTILKPNPGSEEKPHGAFFAFTDGGDLSASTFLHAPEGVLPPAREGGPQYNCDGKGIDSIELCFFVVVRSAVEPGSSRLHAPPLQRAVAEASR